MPETPKKNSGSDPKSSSPSERKLVAILFVDIVGYTTMMQRDEQNASLLLRHFQRQLNEQVIAFGGHIVNFYGDGCLCTFPIPIEALRCAMALQLTFRQTPAIPVRMGIHSGTVTVEGEKIFGDSVNIASRIESMGVPGGILLSRTVRNEVKNNPDLQLRSLGQFEFKNVEEPMEVYALANDNLVVPESTALRSRVREKKARFPFARVGIISLLAVIAVAAVSYFISSSESEKNPANQEKPSIVILPFDNLSGDAGQEFLADGIADEIRTALSGIDRLKVISRSSSQYFKGKNVSQREIAEALKVRHVLSGSVLQYNDQIRINVELSNAQNDEVEWSLKTDQQSTHEIFDIQREIAQEVAKQLRVKVSEQEFQKAFSLYSKDPKIHQKFMQHLLLLLSDPMFNLDKAQTAFEEILEQEPNNVPALRALAATYQINGLFNIPKDSAIKLAKPLYLKAEELDEDYLILPGQFGAFKFWFEWDFAASEAYAQKGNARNDEWSITLLMDYYVKMGDMKKTKVLLDKMKNLNPLNLFTNSYTSRYLMYTGDFARAEQLCLSSIEQYPQFRESYFDLGRIYLVQNKNQEAADILELGVENLGAELPYYTGYLAIAYHRLGLMDKFDKVVRKLEAQFEAGAPGSPAYFLGAAFCNTGQPDRGFDWLEKSFRVRDVEMTWLKMDPAFEPVKSDSRYQALLDRVGFPKPLLD